MTRGVCVLWSLIWVLMFVANGSDAGMKWQKYDEKKPEKFMCYQCNSLYDSRCGDPFDPYTLGYVDCNLKDPPEHLNSSLKATLCRKTVQTVQGKTRVIRGCGYVRDTKYDGKKCMVRTGTHEVHVTYCTCNSSLCNTGHLGTYPSISTTLGITATGILVSLISELLHLG